jgi:UDP-N-acetylglucosamine--N-acetylmuramyl-(pentapeptide) pyrophosphoryl-undecaprenol N-acetylglucosamine transferase
MLKKYGNFSSVALAAKPFAGPMKKKLLCLWSQLLSFFKSIEILRKNRINCVIGMGGFTNIPIVAAAFVLRKKIILHESNRVIGRSVRLLAPLANTVFLPDSVRFKSQSLKHKTLHIPMPLRGEMRKIDRTVAREKLGLAVGDFTIVVLGGSQGASVLNSWATNNLKKLNGSGVAVCCACGMGRGTAETVIGNSKEGGKVTNLFLPFCDDMATLLSAADLLVCQAGAGTIAEAEHFELPMVLVPYKDSADNHQDANAKYAEGRGAAIVVRQNEMEVLTKTVLECQSRHLDWFKFRNVFVREKSSAGVIVDRAQELVRDYD